MPRTEVNVSTAAGPMESERASEPENPDESDEKVDFDEDNEEIIEEEVEYEEVEEEIEEEEMEEEVVEEEVEQEDDDNSDADGGNSQQNISGNEVKIEDEDEKKKHAELLALPPHGSEVYFGGIPQDASEEDLRRFCESIGQVMEVRIVKDKESGKNKGFAFVTFRSVDLALKAIDELNNAEFKGKKMKCSTSQARHRLFIGNVPRDWGEEDLKKIVMETGPGVSVVELVKDVKNSSNNRGFAFINYCNHACAEYSRQKMTNPNFKLGNNAPTVSWADPKNADSSAASQVKAIYVKNLPEHVTQDQLIKLFEHHGKITKVVLPPAKAGQEKNRICFVHFVERSSAMKALKNTERYELDGQVLECSLAKPQTDQKSGGGSNPQKPALLPNYPPSVGYGLVGGAYGGLAPGYGAVGFTQPQTLQPLIYGRGPTPARMAMMPMLLPDGRIGYVLQQHGVQPHTPPVHQRNNNRGGNGAGRKTDNTSSKGKNSNDGSHGHRYHPY